jgi:hypothetical protein
MTSSSLILVSSGNREQKDFIRSLAPLFGFSNVSPLEANATRLRYGVAVGRTSLWIWFIRADTAQGCSYGPRPIIVSIYSASGVRGFSDSNDGRDEIVKSGLNQTTTVTHLRLCLRFALWRKVTSLHCTFLQTLALSPFFSNLDDL